MSTDLIANAESKVLSLVADYLAWLKGDLATLEGLVDEMSPESPRIAPLAERVHGILHNMKGNGATFGYDLVTAIAQSGCNLVRNQTAIDQGRREALRHHVAALRIVVDKRITGAGGEAGKRLMARLQAIAAPFQQA